MGMHMCVIMYAYVHVCVRMHVHDHLMHRHVMHDHVMVRHMVGTYRGVWVHGGRGYGYVYCGYV